MEQQNITELLKQMKKVDEPRREEKDKPTHPKAIKGKTNKQKYLRSLHRW